MTELEDARRATAPAGGARFHRNVVALLVGELVNKGTRFAASVLLARSLSLEDFGTVNVAIAIAGIAVMCAALGMPEIGARDIAAGGEPRRLAGLVLTLRLGALAGLAVIGWAVATIFATETTGWLALTFGMALGLSLSVDWLLRGRGAMLPVSISTATGGAVVLAGCAVFVPLDPSVDVALAIFVAGELVAAGSTWAAARLRGVRRPTGRDLRIALRRAWPVALSALMVYAYLANLDTVLLAALRSAEDAGLYSAPYRVFLALNVVGTFAAYSLLPGVTRSVVGGDPPGARAAIEEHLGALGAYGLGVLGAVELVAADLLGMLFGSPFESMRSTFIVLVIAVPWYSVLFPVGYTLIGFERTKAYLAGAAAAGVLNVLMGLALIPVAGTIGAAVATTAALVVAGVVWLVLARLLDARTIRLGSVLALASAGGVVAAASEDAAPFAGGATLLAAVALLGFSRRASQARR